MWLGRGDINWYSDCQAMFIELFGQEKLQLVCRLFAATSINTSLKANITLFRRAFYEIENGLPIGDYLPNIRQQLQQIREGSPLTGRKINNFANAMAGDKNAVVVDVWILRAFGQDKKYFRRSGEKTPDYIGALFTEMWSSYPLNKGLYRSGGATDRQYTLIEAYIQEQAREMGLEPRQFCAMLWAGIRIQTTGNNQTHYREQLRYQLDNLFKCI